MFTSIPGFSKYEINHDGIVRNRFGNIISISLISKGYQILMISSDTGKAIRVGVHILLSLAFLPIPNGLINPFLNHKDGNKINNVLDNLEWTDCDKDTRAKLCSHARCILAMNEITRKVVSFHSQNECGRFFGVYPGCIYWRLNSSKQAGPYKGFFLKYADDPTPWPEKGLTYKNVYADGISVVLTHIKTGLVEQHSSMCSAARKLGCKGSDVRYQLHKPSPIPYRGYIIRYG